MKLPSARLFQPVPGCCHQVLQISGKRMRFFHLFLCAVLHRYRYGSCNPRIFQRFSFCLPQPFLRLCFLENPQIHRRMPPHLCLCVHPGMYKCCSASHCSLPEKLLPRHFLVRLQAVPARYAKVHDTMLRNPRFILHRSRLSHSRRIRLQKLRRLSLCPVALPRSLRF